MTTHPSTPTTADADRALADRAASSGEYLAGILAAAMLDTVGQPEKLPALLFPGLDPNAVELVWEKALVVGYRLGRLIERPRWDTASLRRLRTALADAGYEAMDSQVARSLATVHPADTEPVRERP
ncbi:hypothetical protein ACH4TP_37875 [Streptomyces sp. NPDC021012]|uniref:hypothetical protein n=1 Tax=Streptomyces sp. NPDC021012 TaxID=3365107 RepID=UPI0037BB7F6C